MEEVEEDERMDLEMMAVSLIYHSLPLRKTECQMNGWMYR